MEGAQGNLWLARFRWLEQIDLRALQVKRGSLRGAGDTLQLLVWSCSCHKQQRETFLSRISPVNVKAFVNVEPDGLKVVQG